MKKTIIFVALLALLFSHPTIAQERADSLGENTYRIDVTTAKGRLAVKGHDIPHPGVTKIPHPINQEQVHARGVIHKGPRAAH